MQYPQALERVLFLCSFFRKEAVTIDPKHKLKNYKPTAFMLPTSHYDKRKADHAVAFIQSLKHTKGEWAGSPFELIAWQEELIRNIFGTVKANDYRQFNTAFVETSKKSGKSELAATVALYLLCADGEQGGEIYSCASDRKQAGIVFEVAKDMIMQCPAILKRVKILDSQKRIIYHPTRSIYQVLSSDVASKFGYNVHACIFDELLAQPDRKLYDVMTKGAGIARKQPLNFVITTAGSDRNSICYEVHQKAMDIIEGRKIDPTFYPVVYSTPTDADWTDAAEWRKSNPSLGVTFTEETLQLACDSAKENPAEEMFFRQFFLCQWTQSNFRWLPMDKWDACKFDFSADSLKGRICYAGLDLSSTTDLTALVLVFPPLDEEDKYIVLPFFWIPKNNIDVRVRKDHVPYDVWESEGHIITTEGDVIHYAAIERFIGELSQTYNIKEIAYDRWGATQMVQNLEAMGITVVPFGQGYVSMNAPTNELLRLVLGKSLVHNGHPVLRWNIDNIQVDTKDVAVKISKAKSTERVDGAVALVMALARALVGGGSTDSIYNSDERDGRLVVI